MITVQRQHYSNNYLNAYNITNINIAGYHKVSFYNLHCLRLWRHFGIVVGHFRQFEFYNEPDNALFMYRTDKSTLYGI